MSGTRQEEIDRRYVEAFDNAVLEMYPQYKPRHMLTAGEDAYAQRCAQEAVRDLIFGGES